MSHEALIARLEALIGSDRELDAEIDVALFGGETVWKTANYTMESYPASRRLSATHIGGFANEHVPSYTASLDAAVALVERVLPGWRHAYEKRTSGTILAWVTEEDDAPCIPALGPTPAIALLIATLKALSSRLLNKEDRNG